MAKRITVKYHETGESGTQLYAGHIAGEEYNRKLVGIKGAKIYDEMRRSDSTVRETVWSVKYPIIAAEYFVTPASDKPKDQEIAAFVRANLFEIIKFRHAIEEILTCVEFGYSVMEMVFEPREVEGKLRIALSKLAFRKQTSIWKWLTEDDKPGITQYTVNGNKSVALEKMARFTIQQEGDNYEGISMLRPAYKHWYYKDKFYKMEAVAYERQAVGVPEAHYPTNATDAEKKAVRQLLRNIRANHEAYMMSPIGWETGFMNMGATSTKDVKPGIDHHDVRIAGAVFGEFFFLGQKSAGSKSLSEDQSKFFMLGVEALADMIYENLNDTVVKTLVDLNFTTDVYPTVEHGNVGDDNLQLLSESVSKYVAAGALKARPEDENIVRKQVGWPLLTKEEMDERKKAADAARDNLGGTGGIDNDTPDKSSSKRKPVKDGDTEGELNASVVRPYRLDASVSSRDFPDLYKGLDIDPEDLGCIMIDTQTLGITKYVENADDDLIEATSRHEHAMGAVAETEAHVTLLYGLLENGNIWKDKVDTVLTDWGLDSVVIKEVGAFKTPDSFAIVAHIEPTPALIDGHDRLTLLPHIQTFSEYKPHLTLAYVKPDQSVANKWVAALGEEYNGRSVKVTGINYGDEPTSDKPVKASALVSEAQALHNKLTKALYGNTSREAA